MTPSLRELDIREFGDWPLVYRAIACVLLALLALGIPWMLLTRPTSTQRQALVAAAHTLQTRLTQARQQADALPPQLPNSVNPTPQPPPNLPALMTALAKAAHAAGLHDGQLRAKPLLPTETDTPTNAAIELHLHGTWTQLSRFAIDLTAPTWNAILSLHDFHLRPHDVTSMLELSATVQIHPSPGSTHITPISGQPISDISGRNPFSDISDTADHTPHAPSQAVIGSIDSGHGQANLVLTADGQLRRVAIQESFPRQ